MLQVAPYDWDDVEEPTDDELHEIDAAVAAAPKVSATQFVDAWLASYPVKAAVQAVGLPDGSGAWLIAFTAELFAQTEAVAPYRDKADRVFELATQWHHALGRRGWTKRGHMPLHLLREMVEIMPIEAVARYLSGSEEMGASTAPSLPEPGSGPSPVYLPRGSRLKKDCGPWRSTNGSDASVRGSFKVLAREQMDVQRIERLLFPLLDLDRARQAVAMVRAGTPPKRAAEAVGISYQNGLARYLKALRVEAVSTDARGQRRPPPSVRQRILDLAAEGLGPKAVHDQINAETGLGLQYPAVKMLIHRARKAAA